MVSGWRAFNEFTHASSVMPNTNELIFFFGLSEQCFRRISYISNEKRFLSTAFVLVIAPQFIAAFERAASA